MSYTQICNPERQQVSLEAFRAGSPVRSGFLRVHSSRRRASCWDQAKESQVGAQGRGSADLNSGWIRGPGVPQGVVIPVMGRRGVRGQGGPDLSHAPLGAAAANCSSAPVPLMPCGTKSKGRPDPSGRPWCSRDLRRTRSRTLPRAESPVDRVQPGCGRSYLS
jgi:hypothetical protein